jgi:hypothetical protein
LAKAIIIRESHFVLNMAFSQCDSVRFEKPGATLRSAPGYDK